MFAKLFGRPATSSARHPVKATPLVTERDASHRPQNQREGTPSYTKVFRYRLPEGEMREPKIVEVAGSFNRWQRVPLIHNGKLDGWHVTIHHIPGHRTHRYMIFIDGVAALDHTCDGLAVPHGPEEENSCSRRTKGRE